MPRRVACAGLSHRAPARMAMAMATVARKSQVPAAASAALAAHMIDEKASANVAVREETCRRRKLLRRAGRQNQSWMAKADAEAVTMPNAVTAARRGAPGTSARRNGMNTTAIAP